MAKGEDVLERLWGICLSLPDTKETITWGTPHFRVGEKIFAGFGEEKGVPVIGFKLEMEHARAVVSRPGFWKAPYVGNKGWVSMDASKVTDWDEVEAMILESYRLIAPKRTLARLDAAGEATTRPGRSRTAPARPARKK